MSEYVIKVKNAVKRFKETCALDHVSLNFEKGQIHGLVGRNGSGKTVLFKCICGLMTLTEGEILINGEPIRPAKAQNIGVIIENPGFIGAKSGMKNLCYLAALRGTITKEQAAETMRRVGLDPESRKHVSKYSLGMRQRLGIAQAIMENPDILILDEPMNGLDNTGVQDIRTLLLELKAQGKTILLASHNREDISVLCDTVHEMDGGRLSI